MSEANVPSQNSGLPEPLPFDSPDPGNPSIDWGELASLVETGPQSDVASQDWQTIDFPGAISVDAIPAAKSEPAGMEAFPTNAGSPNDASVEMSDLLALIQELNQCNRDLLQRASNLETELDQNQTALQAEIARSQEQQAFTLQQTQELAAAQEQVTQLFNQLEFAQQTSQRQQILIETLTAQLENSQERVAQLERECALTQQRSNEQSHLLLQSENTCRDLRTRLQRQQRYTLQFKAALEKCLDVPPPQYEASAEVHESPIWPEQSRAAAALVPKANRIQPWSAQPGFPAALLGESSMGMPDKEPALEPFEPIQSFISESLPLADQPPEPNESLKPQPEPKSHLLDLPMESDRPVRPASGPQPISYNLKSAAQSHPAHAEALTPEEEALAQENETVLARFLEQLGHAVEPVSEEELDAEHEAGFAGQAISEEMLWEDLAKLIEVSAEDVMKASQSGDFEQFEDPRAIAPSPTPEIPTYDLPGEVLSAHQVEHPAEHPAEAATEPSTQPSSQPATEAPKNSPLPAKPISVPAAFVSNTNSPSPLVYPFRPSRKIASLAAVDLPSFPR